MEREPPVLCAVDRIVYGSGTVIARMATSTTGTAGRSRPAPVAKATA